METEEKGNLKISHTEEFDRYEGNFVVVDLLDSPIRNERHFKNHKDNHTLMNDGVLTHRKRGKSKSRNTLVKKLTGINYDSLLAMTISQAKEIEKSYMNHSRGNHKVESYRHNNDSTKTSN